MIQVNECAAMESITVASLENVQVIDDSDRCVSGNNDEGRMRDVRSFIRCDRAYPYREKSVERRVREKVLIFPMVSDARGGPRGSISFTENSGKSLIVNQYARVRLSREKNDLCFIFSPKPRCMLAERAKRSIFFFRRLMDTRVRDLYLDISRWNKEEVDECRKCR